ncbi:MAG: DUF58 domain-containing protein [Pseudomarimonas sp.]
MRAMTSAWRERLLRAAEAKLPALTRLKASEALPITLDRRRIYVVPTQFGLFFGAFLAAMTLGALNYNNNPALILCFLLASVAHSGLLLGFLALRGVRLQEVIGEPVHAGESVNVRLRFDAAEPRQRHGLVLRRNSDISSFALGTDAGTEVTLQVPTSLRGWLKLGRVELSMRRPLGMFVCWSWLHPPTQLLIFPALEANPPPLPLAGGEGSPVRQRGPEEEVHGLRDYRVGDPLRSIAWKRSAQQARTLVKEFESPAGHDVQLDWDRLPGLGMEQRISRLATWVVESERRGCTSELRIPGQTLGPARGRAHLHACLRALALYETTGADGVQRP